MEKSQRFTHLHQLAEDYRGQEWSEPVEGVDDAGGRYFEIMSQEGDTIIGEFGRADERLADYFAAASPAVICETHDLIESQTKRIEELEANIKSKEKFNVSSALIADFQEFIYRTVSQVPFEHAEWANQKGQALMAALKSVSNDASN